MTRETDDQQAVAEALRHARRVAVLTGAGISAESGVPTFRDAQTGLWAAFKPETLATPEAFGRDPQLVWEWYTWRRHLVTLARPNPGHLALVEIEERVPAFTLITQNIDGLHQRAGSRNVVELHGNLTRARCLDEGTELESWPEGETPPRCPRCGGLLRPDVVWFGEMLPEEALAKAWQAAEECDLFFSAGTSAVVEPAASLPYAALRNGARVVEINPTTTPLSAYATWRLEGPAGEVLPALVRAAWPQAEVEVP